MTKCDAPSNITLSRYIYIYIWCLYHDRRGVDLKYDKVHDRYWCRDIIICLVTMHMYHDWCHTICNMNLHVFWHHKESSSFLRNVSLQHATQPTKILTKNHNSSDHSMSRRSLYIRQGSITPFSEQCRLGIAYWSQTASHHNAIGEVSNIDLYRR